MDYVVFGIGFGATLVLLGWALRTFGPELRYQSPDDGEAVLSGEALLGKLAWTRFVTALGAVVATSGTVMLIVTVVTILMTPRDRVGTLVVLSCFLLLLIAACGWAFLYINRYGTHGILSPRTEPAAPLRTPREAAEGGQSRPREAAASLPTARATPAAPVGDLFAAAPAPVQIPHDEPLIDFSVPATSPYDDLPADEHVVTVDDHAEVFEAGPTNSAHDDVADDIEADQTLADDAISHDGGEDGSSDGEVPGEDAVTEVAVEHEDDPQFVDILPRTMPSPEESGRAEALRNLRMRRSSRYAPEQE